jgi:primosomal protein N'
MIARVIPAIRTPRHVAFFDYAIPEGTKMSPGDLVRVPFRTRSLIGVVDSVEEVEDSGRALKSVSELYGNIHLSRASLKLLHALAAYSFSSPATVLHAWVGTLPKRSGASASSVRQPTMLATHETLLRTNRWDAPDGLIARVERAHAAKQRALVLTPWASSAHALAARLQASVLTSDKAPGARFRAWSGFIRGDDTVLVATRIGAWLATEADLVIVDEPENDDHKQDELSPRYDARWLVAQAVPLGTSVIELGLTPRLQAITAVSDDQLIRDVPSLRPTLHAIDIHRADWSPVATLQNRTLTLVEEAEARGASVIIIHAVYGDRARLRCKDCGWTAVCARCGATPALQGAQLVCRRCAWKGSAVAACPSCNGTQLSHSRAGRDTLARDLAARGFEHTRVMSLGEWHASRWTPEAKSAQSDLVVLTDLSALAGGTEDVRRRERLMIAFRRLADDCMTDNTELAVQGDALLLTDARTWLTADGCITALKREYADRQTFALPPTARLVKLVIRGPQAHAEEIAARLRSQTQEAQHAALAATVNGPYAVPHLPGTREPRSTIHLTCPKSALDAAIQALLGPILDPSVFIDLDPIAFFE